jgi:hypothetical protein
MVTVVPAPSTTLIVSFPTGGVTVVPVANCTQPAGTGHDVIVVIPLVQIFTKGVHEPPQAVQVAELVIGVEDAAFQYDQVKVGVPPDTVKLPFVSLHTFTAEHPVTVIIAESVPQPN